MCFEPVSNVPTNKVLCLHFFGWRIARLYIREVGMNLNGSALPK